MNKIKIIDLLNKVANGEEVPKKVIYKRDTFEYYSANRAGIRYVCGKYDGDYKYLMWCINDLNDEVEVVEKATLDGENDLISLIPYKRFCFVNYDPDTRDIVERIYKNEEKINEIIKKVNKMQK